MPVRFNHAAVIVAAIVFYVFGAIWYSVFSRPWLALIGKTAEQVHATGSTAYVVSAIVALLVAYVVGIALTRGETHSARHGMEFGIFMGIGLFFTLTWQTYAYEARPFGLLLINAGYVVIGLAIMGTIIGGWPKRKTV